MRSFNFKETKFYKMLHKDIKEFNSIVLSLLCISVLVGAGLLSYKINESYAIFTDVIKGEKVIEVTVAVPPATQLLMAKVGQSGLEEVTHEADSTLQIGTTEDITEYRFRGGNDVVTNNYVYFNCSDINNQTSSTCELYRIIGVFPTDDGTGNIENRIKLIKATAYNDDNMYYWNTNGTNNWAEPATLNTEFNTTYYGTINTSYQSLIGNSKYYLGGYNSSNIYTSAMYKYERKTSGSDYYYSSNPNSWTGKMALMYVSDYGYGTNSACSESTYFRSYDTCKDSNWLYSGFNEWIINQFPVKSSNVFGIASTGFANYSDDDVDELSMSVRPVFYLTADAEFNDIGDGSLGNPYQLK